MTESRLGQRDERSSVLIQTAPVYCGGVVGDHSVGRLSGDCAAEKKSEFVDDFVLLIIECCPRESVRSGVASSVTA